MNIPSLSVVWDCCAKQLRPYRRCFFMRPFSGMTDDDRGELIAIGRRPLRYTGMACMSDRDLSVGAPRPLAAYNLGRQRRQPLDVKTADVARHGRLAGARPLRSFRRLQKH